MGSLFCKEEPKKSLNLLRQSIHCNRCIFVKCKDRKFFIKHFEYRNHFTNEIDILKKCKIYGIPTIQPSTILEQTIIYKYFPHPDFYYLIENNCLTQGQKMKLYVDIIKTVHIFHDKIGIEHHDLKLENIIVNVDSLQHYIIDFEMATNREDFYKSLYKGTLNYFAPESVFKNIKNEFGKKDIWALGIMYIVLFHDEFIIKKNEYYEYDFLINYYRKSLPEPIYNCLEWFPKNRINCQELVFQFEALIQNDGWA
jgi:serine/threonine protein kinase